MRLNRLDLTRYGKFTGHVIDFGRHAPGQPDLHVIYGPNEAGKSTAFAAFLDLLFGIEARSRFNFLHPYPAMRIGACVQLANGTRELVRIKKPQNSLLDGNGRSISEGVILGELGGLDRQAYRDMFSLDDDTLEAGGENILASRGDLGQLLFSASTGLAELSRSLVDVKAETDGFYKYRARTGELLDLKAQLAALKEERERIDTFASDYAQFVSARKSALDQYQEANAECGRIRSRIDEIQRHLGALPRLAALRALRETLRPLADLPDAPLGWLEELPKLQSEEIELTTRASGVAGDIEQLSAELAASLVDDTALQLAGRVDDLAERRARFVTAERDLPDRRLQLQELERTISGLLGRLEKQDEADPARLVLTAQTVGDLRALIETRSGVETAAAAARREVLDAKERLDEAREAHHEAAGRASTGRKREAQITAIAATAAALRGSDMTARRRVAERARASSREALAERMAALRPWSGDAEQLAVLALPDAADIERWKAALAQAQTQIERQEEAIERLQSDQRRIQAELDAISRVGGVVSEQDAACIRTEREEAWAYHRTLLDTGSAASFETALRRDDIVVNTQLRREKEVAKLHQASEALAVLEADLRNRSERLTAAYATREATNEEIAASLGALMQPLPGSLAPAQLESWIARRDKALEARASLRQAERELREAKADIAAACQALSEALTALRVPLEAELGFEALLATAQATVDGEAEAKTLRATVQDRERELKVRERALKAAAGADESWLESWAQACSSCWLGEDGSVSSVAAVREILVALAELGPILEKRAGLADRIRKMEGDQAAFGEEVATLARMLRLDTLDDEILGTAQRVNGHIGAARQVQSLRAVKLEALDAAQARQRGLDEALAIHASRGAEMTAFFQVGSLAEVGVKLQDAAKRADLQSRAEDTARDIVEALRSPSIEAAEASLDIADRAAMEAELAGLRTRLEDQDQRARELYSAHSKAADRVEAVGGDDAAARIEERRRTTLLDIEERAHRYFRLRVGVVAAEQALHVYRERHRSSMMARASGAFRTISRDAYTSLTTQMDKDTEILIAVAADGSSKLASDLSKGTRFQLYLALRVAGYYEFAQSRRPVPFIADDIMETFDEFRAEETFRVCAEMAGIGQVIYLTHHQHLCEIARRICPGVQIHDLTAAVSPAEAMTSAA